MVGGMVQYSRNSFAFTKLIIHIQQIVFIFKNENILIQQNSYSHSIKILFIFNKNLIHIQQKSYSYSTKISFTFNKNLIHIQQKSHSHSTHLEIVVNKSQKPLRVCHTTKRLKWRIPFAKKYVHVYEKN